MDSDEKLLLLSSWLLLSQKILNVKKEGRGRRRSELNFGFKGKIPMDSILSYFVNCVWRKRSLPFYSTKSNLKFTLHFVLEICGMLISNCWLVKNLFCYISRKNHIRLIRKVEHSPNFYKSYMTIYNAQKSSDFLKYIWFIIYD